jgi:hypothetical protein
MEDHNAVEIGLLSKRMTERWKRGGTRLDEMCVFPGRESNPGQHAKSVVPPTRGFPPTPVKVWRDVARLLPSKKGGTIGQDRLLRPKSHDSAKGPRPFLSEPRSEVASRSRRVAQPRAGVTQPVIEQRKFDETTLHVRSG